MAGISICRVASILIISGILLNSPASLAGSKGTAPLQTSPEKSACDLIKSSEAILGKVPSPSTHSASVEEVKTNLKDKFRGKKFTEHESPEGTVTLGQAEITVDGQNVPIFYKIESNKIYYVVPREGATLEDTEFDYYNFDNCLQLKVDLETKQDEIQVISTGEDCILGRERKGTFLINLAEQMAREHLSQRSYLSDVSRVSCASNELLSADFAFLQLMKKGSTWYEDNGFTPTEASEDTTAKSHYQTLKAELRNDSLESISRGFQTLTERASTPESLPPVLQTLLRTCGSEIKAFLTHYQAFKATTTSDHLGDFVTWLWQSHCDQYPAVMSALFPGNPSIYNILSVDDEETSYACQNAKTLNNSNRNKKYSAFKRFQSLLTKKHVYNCLSPSSDTRCPLLLQ